MNPEIVLEIEGGYLRPLQLHDVYPGYISGLNNPEVNRYLDGVKQTPQTEQSVADFVLDNQQSANGVLFGIWQPGSLYHCGTVRLHGIEHYHGTAYIGVCLFDKSTWGERLGSKAIKAVTKWAFDILGLRWIEAGTYADNVASQKAFLAGGYKWVYDIPGKYLLEGMPATVKVFAAQNTTSFEPPP